MRNGSHKHSLHLFYHFIIGCLLILKGYNKLSHHHYVSGGIILSFGVIILLYFIYVLFVKEHSKNLNILVHFFEALAALFTAYIFFQEGSVYLPYLSLAASIGFFISVFVLIRKRKE